MRPIEIEAWAYEVIDAIKAQGPQENARVEVKADWPEPAKAARAIAGHANAARGASILWLIGVDEDARKVTGVQTEDFATWWPGVESFFDGSPPRLYDLNIYADGNAVTVLHFETVQPPYVVRNPKHGRTGEVITHEVPWRSNTMLRSAKHEDLVRMLAPLAVLPTIQALRGTLTIAQRGSKEYEFNLSLTLYVVPSGSDRVVIPRHMSAVEVTVPVMARALKLGGMRLTPPMWGTVGDPRLHSLTVTATTSEVLIDGPGQVIVTASRTVPASEVQGGTVDSPALVEVSLRPVSALMPVEVSVQMAAADPGGNQWLAWALPEDDERFG